MKMKANIKSYLRKCLTDDLYCCGFTAGILISIFLNLFPLYATWEFFMTDGFEKLGFPFAFRKFGGYLPVYKFSFLLLTADIIFAFAVSVSLAHFTRFLTIKTKNIRVNISLKLQNIKKHCR